VQASRTEACRRSGVSQSLLHVRLNNVDITSAELL
jgi:hypothetical protein